MNTNKGIITLVLVLFVSTLTFGQRRPDKEKIKSLKVAYITERLNLTSKEAQMFWPIYNAYEEEMERISTYERGQIFGKLKEMQSLTEKEVDAILEDLTAMEKEKYQLRQKFMKDIRGVISAKKTVLLIKTEYGFKRRLLKQYRHKQEGRQ